MVTISVLPEMLQEPFLREMKKYGIAGNVAESILKRNGMRRKRCQQIILWDCLAD